MRKIITFAVPCYNSAAYMDKCIDALLPGGEDIEIIIVDDGSTDETPQIADRYASKYPDIIRVIHQENKGHGGAVNTGIAAASGIYFKVVDSDDWLDAVNYPIVLNRLKTFIADRIRVDMLIANYIYDHTADGTSHAISYANALPQERPFGWGETRRFRMDQNLLMHSVIYRTKVLRESGIKLPEHTFYVDNLFVYIPLPYVKVLYYIDVDLYHYYIGREDQSVNEQVMIGRIDQQIRVNKLMIDAFDLEKDVANSHLRRYMRSYLTMICCVTSILLLKSGTKENEAKRKELWRYLKARQPKTFWKVRLDGRGIVSNPHGPLSRWIVVDGYRKVQKKYHFN